MTEYKFLLRNEAYYGKISATRNENSNGISRFGLGILQRY